MVDILIDHILFKFSFN